MSEEAVSLRPIAEADLPAFNELVNDPEAAGEFQWYGWGDPDRFRRRWAENGLMSDEQWVFAVTAGGEFLGFVAATRKGPRPTSRYWSIGVQLLPRARGRGIGTQAQRLLVDYLFAYTPVMRLEADTEAGNLAEQRVLEKLGFTREGVHRAVNFRDGAWRDMVFYSLLRTDARPEHP
ncbi:GNAT family N-acetyltransferase [Kitasatospora sp. SUK 42]|uniref:GNAT family N-acetyltransferase n=1 Tax=Kitasatospora sp. SUK 42 TaxID=1588882 RepID=UPI0018CB995B|nr:GNAT family protein [Kitasatospora sp. SUK 42]MBV2153467.1 GNAT family N-acetyltransferase [Kitasatospora sp. SUK 42]